MKPSVSFFLTSLLLASAHGRPVFPSTSSLDALPDNPDHEAPVPIDAVKADSIGSVTQHDSHPDKGDSNKKRAEPPPPGPGAGSPHDPKAQAPAPPPGGGPRPDPKAQAPPPPPGSGPRPDPKAQVPPPPPGGGPRSDPQGNEPRPDHHAPQGQGGQQPKPDQNDYQWGTVGDKLGNTASEGWGAIKEAGGTVAEHLKTGFDAVDRTADDLYRNHTPQGFQDWLDCANLGENVRNHSSRFSPSLFYSVLEEVSNEIKSPISAAEFRRRVTVEAQKTLDLNPKEVGELDKAVEAWLSRGCAKENKVHK